MSKEYYGQPLINGIVIRNGNNECTAILDKTKIKIKKSHIENNGQFDFLINLPFIRGMIIIFKYLASFVRTLNNSADLINDEIKQRKIKFKNTYIMKLLNIGTMDMIILFALILSFIISFIVFILLPSLITYIISHKVTNLLFLNLLETTLRILVLYIFLKLSSKIKRIKDMYQYHGALHKILNCANSNERLTIKNIRSYELHSDECGLSFLFSTMIYSTYIMSIAQTLNFIQLSSSSRIVYFLLLSGLIYEVLQYFKSLNKESKIGKLFQSTMVIEPEDNHIKVVLSAYTALRKENSGNTETTKQENE